jgi:hypothetical protein
MNSDTQPLTPAPEAEELSTEEQAAREQALQAWNALINDPPHIHGPFTFLMNQNHNALRGCITCGQAWVGVMAGSEDSIRWHAVQEPPEEEE